VVDPKFPGKVCTDNPKFPGKTCTNDPEFPGSAPAMGKSVQRAGGCGGDRFNC